jgi:hypothetical protein
MPTTFAPSSDVSAPFVVPKFRRQEELFKIQIEPPCFGDDLNQFLPDLASEVA